MPEEPVFVVKSGIAQLVERHLDKVEVAGSSPASGTINVVEIGLIMSDVKNKPLVLIRDAHIGKFDWGDYDVLYGTAINHPKDRLNGKLIHTSKIIKHSGDLVETQNTLYQVANWKPIKELLRSNKDGD